jgi:Ca-activated chloride channel family protein
MRAPLPLVVALLAVPALAAQVFHSEIEVVTVTVTVTDKDGRLVGGLSREDFVVFEDGVPQAIAAFTGERVPVSLGILLDVSDSMFGERMTHARQSLERFLVDLLRPEDEVFLTAFNHRPEMIARWTRDPRTLRGSFDGVKPWGGTALYDAVLASVAPFTARHHARAALLVISDGADTASDATLVATTDRLRRSDPFVYAIAIDSRDRAPINTRVQPEALRALTDPTGGYTAIIHDSTELPAATERIADELNAQYTIGFTPSRPPDGRYHTIRVRIPGGDYFVRARRGYVATRRAR